MHRTAMLPETWWDLTVEALAPAGGPAGEDVSALRAEIDQLRRALTGRTAIDQACGMVMVLAPCRSGAARGLLADVSRQCDVTLPEVAAALIAAWEGEPLAWPTQQALRRALRRFYAEDRGCDSRLPDESSGREGHDSRS
ncbi:ANTAR domain-containing protein [Streptomyces sp. NPDC060065]|uniref:ANTAR domain-containing protein n=1 Tax=Streptomyces sp. NPDC060065 TaxID=3347050 RepID=UPI003692DC2B